MVRAHEKRRYTYHSNSRRHSIDFHLYGLWCGVGRFEAGWLMFPSVGRSSDSVRQWVRKIGAWGDGSDCHGSLPSVAIDAPFAPIPLAHRDGELKW